MYWRQYSAFILMFDHFLDSWAEIWQIFFLGLLENLRRQITSWPQPTWVKVRTSSVTKTTAASKYIPRRSRIGINWNPTFQTSLLKISKGFFFRLTTFFFRNKKKISRNNFCSDFLCIVRQKNRSDLKFFENLL